MTLRREITHLPGGLRRPPEFPFDTPATERAGRCRMCADPIPKRRRRYCSQECGEIADYVWHPRWAAWMLAKDTFGGADRARCFECGAPGPLDLDHIKPLWSLTDAEARELKWWLPFNLQLLCRRCHKAKSAKEAAERAALKRRTAHLAHRVLGPLLREVEAARDEALRLAAEADDA